MADIRPFRGVRYDPATAGDLSRVVSAPYDIISPEAQADYYARSPYNVIALELGSQRSVDDASDNRYTRAAATYREWQTAGVVKADPEPAFYLYEEAFEDHGQPLVRRSLIAPIRVTDWSARIVLPHEFTLPGPKVDRLSLLNAAHAQFSPLLGMYDDPGVIAPLLSEVAAGPPDLSFDLAPGSVSAAARQHRLWRATEPRRVERLVDAFRDRPIYIADGHHRYETALVYRDQQRQLGATADSPSEFALMALVETGDPGMLIRPTHRLLHGLGNLDPEVILRRLAERFEIDRIPAPELQPESPTDERMTAGPARPSFTILGLQAGWAYRIRLRPSVDLARELADVPAVLRTLDTVVLQHLILDQVLGLSPRDVEHGERVQYTRDPTEASRAFVEGRAQLVVFLAPTPMDQIRAAASAGERMPQKSTYFYPKPVTGTVFYDHEVAF
ncbi:MAG: DUF1015 domain-containing protein [Chloroflexota bacterium]